MEPQQVQARQTRGQRGVRAEQWGYAEEGWARRGGQSAGGRRSRRGHTVDRQGPGSEATGLRVGRALPQRQREDCEHMEAVAKEASEEQCRGCRHGLEGSGGGVVPAQAGPAQGTERKGRECGPGRAAGSGRCGRWWRGRVTVNLEMVLGAPVGLSLLPATWPSFPRRDAWGGL